MTVHGIHADPPVKNTLELKDHLARRGHLIRQMLGPLADGLKYCCLEEYVFAKGRSFATPRAVPWDCAFMPDGRCFSNARALTAWSRGELSYVEGFAGTNGVHHACCVDTEGEVWDLTGEFEFTGPMFACAFPNVFDRMDAALNSKHWPIIKRLIDAYHPTYTMGSVLAIYAGLTTVEDRVGIVGPWLTAQHIGRCLAAKKKKG